MIDSSDMPGLHALSRRKFLGLTGAGLAASVLAACGSSSKGSGTTATTTGSGSASTTAGSAAGTTAAAGVTTTAGGAAASVGANAMKFGGGGKDGKLKIGFTAPLSGGLAGFGEANTFIVAAMKTLMAGGVMIGGKSYAVELIERDVQSNSDTAATAAGKLITEDKVDLIMAIATPEMINPVADQCEANGVPCISTLAPWQPYFFGRKGDAAKGFDWTYHWFWGADQLVGVFSNMWKAAGSKSVGLVCPNDPDGNALADAKTGFPAGVAASGLKLVDPGRFNTGTNDFSTFIGQFKSGGVDTLCGIPIPPDFSTFWKQAKQQGFNPKVVTVAKAVLFPAAVEALGDIGDGISSEVWWSPNHPFKSSLTGVSAKEIADQYTKATGKQWTQFVGFVHSLFEVTLDAVARAGSTDKKAIAAAVGKTSLDTIVGNVTFGKGGVPKNIAPTSLVGGQWQKQSSGKFDLVIVENALATNIPLGGKLKVLA
jgi:branched-chain amino acid transport system substrate-binding protein